MPAELVNGLVGKNYYCTPLCRTHQLFRKVLKLAYNDPV